MFVNLYHEILWLCGKCELLVLVAVTQNNKIMVPRYFLCDRREPIVTYTHTDKMSFCFSVPVCSRVGLQPHAYKRKYPRRY